MAFPGLHCSVTIRNHPHRHVARRARGAVGQPQDRPSACCRRIDRWRAWPRRSAAEWAAAQECKPIDRRRGGLRSENNIPSPAARGGAPLPHAKPPRAGFRPPRGADAPSLGSGTPLPKPFLRHTLTSAVRTICNCGARTARLDVLRLCRKPILNRRIAFAPRSRDAPKLFWGACA